MPEPYICGPDHKHAETTTCKVCHGCRCEPCRLAYNKRYSAEQKRRRRAKAYGRFAPMVPATGTIRRIQGLQVLGWRFADIAAEGGWNNAESVQRIMLRDMVRPEMRDRMEAVSKALVARGRGPSETTAQRALAKGWLSLWAWDDPETDLVPVVPEPDADVDEVVVLRAVEGHPIKMTTRERMEAIRILHARRWSDALIASQLHCTDRTVLRMRNNMGLPGWGNGERVEKGQAA